MPSPITVQLEQHFGRLDRLHARQRLAARWADDAALAGHSPASIVELCGQATCEQNPVVAALLRHHQHGDPDAATVLLTALRPMVKAVVAFRYRHITDSIIDNYWAAASHLIGAVDPNIAPVDRDGQPVPFIGYLGNRLVNHLRRLDPAARRWQERRKRGVVYIPFDLSEQTGNLTGTLADRDVIDIEQAALARIELEHIAAAVEHGHIAADRWQQLVEHRLTAPVRPATGRERVAVHRTAHRLAAIVGHAA